MDDFDLDRSTADAWAGFRDRLSEVVSIIDETADLTISAESATDDQPPFLKFSSPARHLVRCEAVGVPTADDGSRLASAQLAAMVELGWRQPTTSGPRPTDSFWIEDSQDNSERVSSLAVAVLRDVLGVPHPVFLAPDQLGEVLRGSPPAGQDLELAPHPAPDQQQLNALVDA